MSGSSSPKAVSKKDSSFQFPPLDTKSKGGIVVLAVIGAVGGAFICLGAINFFGPTGSLNFIATVTGGGVAILIAAGGITYIVVRKKKTAAEGTGAAPGAQQSSRTRSHGVHIFAAPNTRNVKLHSQLAQNVFAWAKAQIKADTPAAKLNGHQPTNPDIAKLVTLCNEAEKEFWATLKRYPNDPWHGAEALAIVREVRSRESQGKNSSYNPWSNPAAVAEVERRVAALPGWNPGDDPWAQKSVLEAATRMIGLAFAISVLTLDDLPAFTAKMANKKFFAESLARQDGYMYKTFFFLPIAYSYLRQRIVCIDANANEGAGRFEALSCEYPTQALLTQLTAGNSSIFSEVFQLYNEFSDRVRQYTTEADLVAADCNTDRYTHASKRDNGEADFDIRLHLPT